MGKVSIVESGKIENKILLIHGHRVIIDRDIAELYGVTTKRLNEQVKRNKKKFPADFMFKLTVKEKAEVVANCDHLKKLKFSPTLPYAFTEHGALMLATVLNSPKAIETSIFIVRAFIHLREILTSHKELAIKFKELELKIESHDEQISAIFEAINRLLIPPDPPKKKIGFTLD